MGANSRCKTPGVHAGVVTAKTDSRITDMLPRNFSNKTFLDVAIMCNVNYLTLTHLGGLMHSQPGGGRGGLNPSYGGRNISK